MTRIARCLIAPLFAPLFAVLFAAFALNANAADTFNAGFQRFTIPGPAGEKPLTAGVWYPTTAEPSEQRNGPVTQDVATDAPLSGKNHPLVVISHGSGGWFGGHYDTAIALAHAGFIVAAVTHRGDSNDDQSRTVQIWIRPAQLKLLTDYMLTQWTAHEAIDPNRIGVFGFSAGAFTALVAAGGTPDLRAVGPYCDQHPQTAVCAVVGSKPKLDDMVAGLNPLTWVHDDRIRAAVVAAPAIGFTFGRTGLADVKVPVQLWRAEFDHVLPSPDYAEAVRDALPTRPEYHVVANADHYDFLPPCSPTQLEHAPPEICASRPGFDRADFHKHFNADVVAFFSRTLGH